jgi:hypothetical protein
MKQTDIDRIAAAVEKRIQTEAKPIPAAKPKRRHWPRRAVILVVTFGLGVLLHHFIEETGLRSALQSTELALAAVFDCIFTKAREL